MFRVFGTVLSHIIYSFNKCYNKNLSADVTFRKPPTPVSCDKKYYDKNLSAGVKYRETPDSRVM